MPANVTSGIHGINVIQTNVTKLGTTVAVNQYTVDLTITYIKADGTTGTVTKTSAFPNVLANAAIPAGWLQDQLVDLMYRAERIIAGIDTVS